jgi:hypothetical protein
MANVAAVHGISQQQSGRNQLLASWAPALRDGIERASGRAGPAIELDLGYYADLFATAEGTTKGQAPSTLDADEVAFLEEIEAEVVDEEPPVEATKGFKGVPVPVARLAAWLDRRFGVAGRVLFIADLVQVRRYQRDDALAAQVRERVAEAIGPDTRVVIGHSLGSIVAYEHLCLTANPGVSTLVTLGSPLGLASIQKALRTRDEAGRPAPPADPGHWVNIYDVNDPVSCAGGLHRTWSPAVDETVENGNEPHSALRYLGKRQAGQAVVDSLRP